MQPVRHRPATSGLRMPDGRVVVDASSVPAVQDLYAMHRAELHRAMRSLLPSGVLRTGAEVTSVRHHAGGVAVEVAGGAPIEADLVAGETWGAGERFGILPLRDGRVYWFAVANLPVGTDVDAHAEVRRRFGGWHAPIPALLTATAPEAVLRWTSMI